MTELSPVPAGHGDPLRAAAVVLVTSRECSACRAAKPLVADVAAEFGVEAREARIEDHPELGPRMGAEIPVLVIDGVPRDFWVIDPARFRRLMAERAA
ncbi:glutaredoxin family protein [Falsarthrobacter nasiphocae]|uniref:Thiol-disulfide isomerase/thioredoxin n=1 Tax=Falsarthrobacter nasiphocae TaxID=189863 RepID=A0AAE4C6P3_9MICC|nr:glutaredoxin family protein [Falsarthrobacter nasiphocae]MDR6892372.1 thiol-disulfide isomerase/thioredoxin [Falsarthrobacter nasiphocae]